MNGLRLRSNPTASLAYRNLSQTQFSLNNTLQRLSSGLRINTVADDSAGSAISTRMNNQIQGMKQANRNAQDVNHLIQTTEGGLNDISGILNRMRELAVQAATDTLNNSDRASIDLEYQALKDEVSRIANVTRYNEMNILNGTYYRNQVDVGNSTADDVTGVSIQALDEVIKGTYTLQDTLETNSNGQLVDAVVTHTSGDSNISISADGDISAGDYRLIRNNSGEIKLETTSDGGTTWTSASTDIISIDSISQGSSTVTFHATNGDVTMTFPFPYASTSDSDSDGVPDFKDDHPNITGKVRDLPAAFSSLSSNLKLWLDASDVNAVEKDGSNSVSHWYDWSGQGNHITQSSLSNKPSYKTNQVNSKATIGFDGINDYLLRDSSTSGLLTNQATVFAVLKSETGNGVIIDQRFQHGGSEYGWQASLGRDSWSGSVVYSAGNEGRLVWKSSDYVNNNNNNMYGYSNDRIPNSEMAIVEIRKNGTNITMYNDGVEMLMSDSNIARANITYNAGTKIGIGRAVDTSGSLNGYYHNGDLAEILVFDKSLSSSEQTQINTYLSQKWGLTATVDSDGDGVMDDSDSDIFAVYQPNDIQVLNEFTAYSNRTLTLTNTDGNSQSLDYTAGNSETLNFSDFGIQVDLDSTYDPSSGLDGKNIEIAASRDLQVGVDNDVNHRLQLGISSVTASGLRIDGSQVVDIDQARAAITSLDNATDVVNQERSYLGSMQNRLSFTISHLTSQTQNIEAARSSIQDTDFAADAADLAKNQILAQSATAMLAQASAISQNILSLIAA